MINSWILHADVMISRQHESTKITLVKVLKPDESSPGNHFIYYFCPLKFVPYVLLKVYTYVWCHIQIWVVLFTIWFSLNYVVLVYRHFLHVRTAVFWLTVDFFNCFRIIKSDFSLNLVVWFIPLNTIYPFCKFKWSCIKY